MLACLCCAAWLSMSWRTVSQCMSSRCPASACEIQRSRVRVVMTSGYILHASPLLRRDSAPSIHGLPARYSGPVHSARIALPQERFQAKQFWQRVPRCILTSWTD